LAPGQNYLIFSISKGTLENSNLAVIDPANDAISYEICRTENKGYFVKWEKNWGNIHFPSGLKLK